MRRVLPVVLTIAVAAPLAADEGMWMLHQLGRLDQAKLRAMGLELTPQQLWDIKTSSGLASAVVSLGGCSASFVSPQGLIATNHHCAFGAIQINSTPEHDYITDGFLAATKADELEAKGSRAYVFLGYDNITDKVTSALQPGMNPEQRTRALEMREKELVAACEKQGLRCRFAEMYGGLEYYMFRTLELRDVRLVYAPPRAIGEYGGEVDNWEWPRHTGDFSFLRAYVGPDGKPADIAPENVPYQPARWLKVSAAPLEEGDFTMIMGYPGRTYRYRTAAAVAENTDFYYPNGSPCNHRRPRARVETGQGRRDQAVVAAQGPVQRLQEQPGDGRGSAPRRPRRPQTRARSRPVEVDRCRSEAHGLLRRRPAADGKGARRQTGHPRPRPAALPDELFPLHLAAGGGLGRRALDGGARQSRHGARPGLPEP
jgi:hypothetical protein